MTILIVRSHAQQLVSSCMSHRSAEDAESPPPEVRNRLQRVLMMPDFARSKADYEFLDCYVHGVSYFVDLPPRDRLQYLRIVKGVELEKGEELFHIGDSADAFYCIMYGSLNVVVDFAHISAPTLDEFDEIINRAHIHSTFLHPGGVMDVARRAMYTVKCMKALECFGDAGLLTSDQLRTASVVAHEKTLCMKIDRDTFLDLRKNYADRELREKIKFIASVAAFAHWDADSILRLTGRIEKVNFAYNDVVIKEGDPANSFYLVKHGECRIVKRFPMLQAGNQACFAELRSISSHHYFGSYEVINGQLEAAFSVLVSSPTAILYRMDRVDFRQTVLKDTLTEQLMRVECEEFAARIDVNNVYRDLNRDAEWAKYKQRVVHQVLEKHQREHASPLLGPRSPRSFHVVEGAGHYPQPSPPSVRIKPQPMPPVSPRRRAGNPLGPLLVEPTSPRSAPDMKRNSRWLQWAKERANSIVNDCDGLEPMDSTTAAEVKTNIRWGKAAKIMGGLDDEAKITSAIVSLFDPKEAVRL